MADPVYTLATFQVTDGKEDEFVAAVRSLQDSAVAMPDAPERGALLRRLDQDRSYISFGVWRRPEDAMAWRSSEGFEKTFTRLQELSDDVVAGPCEVVFEV